MVLMIYFSSCDINCIKHISKLSKVLEINSRNKFKLERLKKFTKIGTDCKFCGRKGEFLVKVKRGTDTCWFICDKEFVVLTIDHIKPKSKGCDNKISNLQPLCYYCNTLKADNTNENLVTIKKIIDIKEIKDAENIELVCVRGYKTYAQKSKYKIGEYVIFIKPNSWIPDELVPSPGTPRVNLGVKGWRLKPKKIMRVPVRGMVLPLSIIDGIDYKNKNIADILNIKPYVIGKGKVHIDSIASRHKKLKQEIINNLPSDIDVESLDVITNMSVIEEV